MAARMVAARVVASAAIAASLAGCAALPAVLAVAGKALPIIQVAAAVAVDAWCSEIVGADGRDAIRSHVYGDARVSLIRRDGC